ncbi:MAG: DUF5678 domain-containing protein [Desulfurococcales archaeon]|nr:DUF5678 domain-containing protein [Desulfurococcales archaeon]
MSAVIRLPKEYRGKFIARLDDKIVAVGDSIKEVKEALRRRGIDPRYAVIDYVPEEDVIFII